MHRVETIPLADTLTPDLRAYAAAMRDGFFEAPMSEAGLQTWHEHLLTDDTRLRVVRDTERPFGKAKEPGLDPVALLPRVLPVYAQVLRELAEAGAHWVQIDEPVLVTDLSPAQRAGFAAAYAELAQAGPKLLVASYFGALDDNLDLALSLPVAGLHVDLVRGSNSHHIAEACFKAVARALRKAVEPDPRMEGALPSTKGML